jgi:translation initiation factor 1A
MKPKKKPQQTDQVIRVRTPRGNEVLGAVTQRLGGSRMYVACVDGKTRICRIPGRLKKNLWIREGNIVLIQPWEFQSDEKGDLIWKYNPTQVVWLKKKGLLKNKLEFEEF